MVWTRIQPGGLALAATLGSAALFCGPAPVQAQSTTAPTQSVPSASSAAFTAASSLSAPGMPSPGWSAGPQNPLGLAFTSAFLAQQNHLVDRAAVQSASTLHLDALRFGDLKLTFDMRKPTPAGDPLPVLRYTVAAAQRDWLRAVTASGPRKLAFTGAFDTGGARGLSFAFARQNGSGAGFSDSRLGFSRNGFESSLRVRDVARGLARSSLLSDAEWNDVKDLLGWKQTDLHLGWTGTPGLRLIADMGRGRNGADGASRNTRRLDFSWKPSSGTAFAYSSDSTTSGRGGSSTRTGTEKLSLQQALNGFGFDLSQETLRNVQGKTGRTRRLSFTTPTSGFAAFRADITDARINGRHSAEQKLSLQTREKAPTWLGLTRVQSQDGDARRTVDSMQFRARPMARLSLNGGLTLTDAGKARTRDASLSMDWKPFGDWKLLGNMRQATGLRQDFLDLHLTGHVDPATCLDARLLRPVDANNPYKRQDTLHLERRLAAETTLTGDYSALTTLIGQQVGMTQLNLSSKLPFGQLTARHRTGGENLVPDQSELAFAGTLGKLPLRLDARYKRTDGAPTTRTIQATWTLRKDISIDGAFAENPEDNKGKIQDVTSQSFGVHFDVRPGLRLDLCRADERRKGFSSRRTDLALAGKLDKSTQLELGFTTRDVTGLPNDPSYRVTVRREVDAEHRLLVQLDRKTRAVHGKDDLAARFELVTDF